MAGLQLMVASYTANPKFGDVKKFQGELRTATSKVWVVVVVLVVVLVVVVLQWMVVVLVLQWMVVVVVLQWMVVVGSGDASGCGVMVVQIHPGGRAGD